MTDPDSAPTGRSRPDSDDVVVVEDVWGDGLEALAGAYRVRRAPDAWREPGSLLAAASSARALVIRNRTYVDASLLTACPRLAVIARAGVGLDNIDMGAADEQGIVVTAGMGANAVSVAEHTLALALCLARGVVGHDRKVRAGGWSRTEGRELRGGTWGLVGLGATGTAVARLAAGLGMKVAGYDPFAAGNPPSRVRVVPLEELLGESDVVSLHVPLTDATRALVDRTFLSQMRSDAYLINVARGGVVDEDALADALDSGLLGGAALDVREQEPPVPGRLEASERTVLTPHVAGLTAAAQDRIVNMLAEDLRRLLDGSEARFAVGRHRRPARSSC